jgi:hypothetical protein
VSAWSTPVKLQTPTPFFEPVTVTTGGAAGALEASAADDRWLGRALALGVGRELDGDAEGEGEWEAAPELGDASGSGLALGKDAAESAESALPTGIGAPTGLDGAGFDVIRTPTTTPAMSTAAAGTATARLRNGRRRAW